MNEGASATISAGLASADAWSIRYRQLAALAKLEDDWDENGAVAPKPFLLAAALDFLEAVRRISGVTAPSRVSPTVDGGVIIEWQSGEHYLEAEISEPHLIQWMAAKGNERPRFWSSKLATAAPMTPDRPEPSISRAAYQKQPSQQESLSASCLVY